ncbi:hypothetical protein EDB81DRAFT_926923 [Dactylonectria macrodidyma]|uniref:Uncharacterized protein n=1 Tax=Dactylonectria macrodidyma TaxID=307937 RepID=A0A9P9D1I9_9HYPO|nr:hypothetical protein EDB81DRAFT_926923 [Dactylonectria macrodidyma]
MSDTQDPKKPKRGLSRLKLDIPLLGKKKNKKLVPAEKKAAEFLSARQGRINDAVDCSPDSGVGIVVDKDEAVLQVELVDANDGDNEPDASPTKLNLAELYKDCFKAKSSYELALDAFVAHKNKKRGNVTAPTSSPDAPAPTETTFGKLEENIKQMEQDVKAAMDKLQDHKDERKARHEEQWLVVQGLRTAFHKFAENARNVRSYVSLVPKSAGFGLGEQICGGINIVLKAAERYEMMDKHMEHGLRAVKEALVHKAYTFARHEPDQRMHQLISELFASIFGVLESLLKWVYQQGTGMALLGVVLQPETYGEDLAELTAILNLRSGAMEMYGRHLEMSKIKERQDVLVSTADKTQEWVQKMLRKQSRQLKALEDVCKGEKDIKAKVGGVAKAVEQAGTETTAEIRELTRRIEQLTRLCKANALHSTFVFISQDPPGPRPGAPQRPATCIPRQAAKAEPGLEAAVVLANVGFDPDFVSRDCRNILRGSRARLSTREGELVTKMTNNVRLQALVEVPSSAVLFVEGGHGRRHEARGPVSVAAARVVEALAHGRETNASIYALAYFCSEHRSAREGFGTATALVITLLLQLIEQHRNFSSHLLSECRGAIMDAPERPEEDDLQLFCNLLRRCVLALPGEVTLFCVIEGIAFFEGPKERTAHMRIILCSLLELGEQEDEEAEAEEGRARIKCLFTTPARSPEFRGLFQLHDVLTI